MTKSARLRGAPRPASRRAALASTEIETVVLAALEVMKAVDVRHWRRAGPATWWIVAVIIASGNLDRHVRAIARGRTSSRARAQGRRPLGVEGLRDGEWVLVDLQDVVLHVMLPRVREFYAIEQLWEAPLGASAAASRRRSPPKRRSAPAAPESDRALPRVDRGRRARMPRVDAAFEDYARRLRRPWGLTLTQIAPAYRSQAPKAAHAARTAEARRILALLSPT